MIISLSQKAGGAISIWVRHPDFPGRYSTMSNMTLLYEIMSSEAKPPTLASIKRSCPVFGTGCHIYRVLMLQYA